MFTSMLGLCHTQQKDMKLFCLQIAVFLCTFVQTTFIVYNFWQTTTSTFHSNLVFHQKKNSEEDVDLTFSFKLREETKSFFLLPTRVNPIT